jgi:regulator-associated protein of mTOR
VDSSCQNDLLKDNGFLYFVNILASNANMPPIPNISEHRAMCCFILSVFCHDFKQGQQACLKANLLASCAQHLSDPDPLLRQWAAICIAELWSRFPDAKWLGIKDSVPDKLCSMLQDIVPEVRASAMLALGSFYGDLDKSEQVALIEQNIALSALVATGDASPLVRRELLCTVSRIFGLYSNRFVSAALELMDEERKRGLAVAASDDKRLKASPNFLGTPEAVFHPGGQLSIYGCLWKVLLNLTVDPHPEIAHLGASLVDNITYQLLKPMVSEKLKGQIGSAPSSASRNTAATDGDRRAIISAYVQRNTQTLPSAQSAPELSNGDMARSGEDGLAAPRRTQANGATARGMGRRTMEPVTPNVSGLSRKTNAEGTIGHQGSPVIQSTLFEWCCEYFAEPQMKVRAHAS